VPAGITLMILRLIKWIKDLKKEIEGACKSLKYGSEQIFSKGLTPQIKFSYGMPIEGQAPASIDWESSPQLDQLKDAKETVESTMSGKIFQRPADLTEAFDAFAAYCQTFQAMVGATGGPGKSTADFMKSTMSEFESGMAELVKMKTDLPRVLDGMPSDALKMITSTYEDSLNLFNRFQVPKPEGLSVDAIKEGMAHMYPATMIDFIEKSATMGGDVGDAFARMHEKAAANVPSPTDYGIPMPNADVITGAVSKMAKTLFGDLLGDVLLGSNPVTGVLLGIRKAYKMTKKAYNLANKAYKDKKAKMLASIGKAVQEMQKSAIAQRVKSNVREVKSSMSAMLSFPKQLKNDAMGISKELKRAQSLYAKHQIALLHAPPKVSTKGGRKGGLWKKSTIDPKEKAAKEKAAKEKKAAASKTTPSTTEEKEEPKEVEPVLLPIVINLGAAIEKYMPRM